MRRATQPGDPTRLAWAAWNHGPIVQLSGCVVSVGRLTDRLGMAHGVARCCWCGGLLVVNQVEQLRCWTCREAGCMLRQVRYGVYVTYTAGQARTLGLKAAGKYCWHVPLPSQVPL